MNKTFEQKQSPWWWTRNLKSTIYFLREATGLGIALYLLAFVAGWLYEGHLAFTHTTLFTIISAVGLVAAIFHTITWLWVTVQVTPRPLPKSLQIAGFIFLLLAAVVATLVVSHLLHPLLNDEPTPPEVCGISNQCY